jgi:hypothetical protein
MASPTTPEATRSATNVNGPLRLHARWDGRREYYEAVRSDAPHCQVFLVNPEIGSFAFQRCTAEEAIRAINSHDDLLAVVEYARTYSALHNDGTVTWDAAKDEVFQEKIRAAIAKAEGRTP